MQPIGAKEQTPAGDAAIGNRISARVPEVQRAGNGDMAARLLADPLDQASHAASQSRTRYRVWIAGKWPRHRFSSQSASAGYPEPWPTNVRHRRDANDAN